MLVHYLLRITSISLLLFYYFLTNSCPVVALLHVWEMVKSNLALMIVPLRKKLATTWTHYMMIISDYHHHHYYHVFLAKVVFVIRKSRNYRRERESKQSNKMNIKLDLSKVLMQVMIMMAYRSVVFPTNEMNHINTCICTYLILCGVVWHYIIYSSVSFQKNYIKCRKACDFVTNSN